MKKTVKAKNMVIIFLLLIVCCFMITSCGEKKPEKADIVGVWTVEFEDSKGNDIGAVLKLEADNSFEFVKIENGSIVCNDSGMYSIEKSQIKIRCNKTIEGGIIRHTFTWDGYNLYSGEYIMTKK